jgi:hypothetical protein
VLMNSKYMPPIRHLALAALLGWNAVGAQETPVQEQVPIPGLTVEESVRLETANEKLKELAVQRDQKNQVRRDEIDKLMRQVEDAAQSGDDLRYQTARERLISYIFASNNKDHSDLSQIVYTVKETQVLGARARIAIGQLGNETQTDSSAGLGGLLEDSQDKFRQIFVTPNQREMVLASSLLSSESLSAEEEQRLHEHIERLVGFNELANFWEQPLSDIPYLPTQIDPAFDNQEAVTFLESLEGHLRFDYKDLEVQLFWSEVLAEIGRRYAAGKLPLVRVQSALNRLGSLSGKFPKMEGKPWFMGALSQLSEVKAPRRSNPWQVPTRQPGNALLKGG